VGSTLTPDSDLDSTPIPDIHLISGSSSTSSPDFDFVAWLLHRLLSAQPSKAKGSPKKTHHFLT